MNGSDARLASVSALLVVFGASFVPEVRAQSSLELAYEAGATCPDRASLLATIEAHLRHAPAGAALVPVEVRVRIDFTSGEHVASVTLVESGEQSHRDLRDPSCAVVADAVAIVVAVTIAPGLDVMATSPPDPAPTPTAGEELPAASVPVEIRGALRLSAHGSIGVLPGVVVGGEIGGALRLDALRLDLAVRGLPLVGARFATDPDFGADVGLVVALLRATGVLALGENFELLGGGGVEVGAALGSAVGISDPRDAAAPWVAIEAVVGAAWVPLRVLALVLEVEALVPVVRPVFTIAGLGVLYRPEPVGGGLRLVLELRFP